MNSHLFMLMWHFAWSEATHLLCFLSRSWVRACKLSMSTRASCRSEVTWRQCLFSSATERFDCSSWACSSKTFGNGDKMTVLKCHPHTLYTTVHRKTCTLSPNSLVRIQCVDVINCVTINKWKIRYRVFWELLHCNYLIYCFMYIWYCDN